MRVHARSETRRKTPRDPGLRFAQPSAWWVVVVALLGALTFNGAAMAQSDAAHQQFLFAYKLLQRNEDRLAAEAFDEYLGGFPQAEKRGDAMYYRALLHRRAGDNEAAAALLSDIPTPQLVPAYAVDLLRGQVLTDLKRYEAALRSLERIEVDRLAPEIAVSVHYLRGLAYRGANNLPAAAQALAQAAAMDTPMKGRALLDLARVQVLMDKAAEAIGTLRQAIDVADAATAAEASRLLGDLHYQRGEYNDAAAAYGRVIARHQSSTHFGPSVLGLLWSHFAAGRYQDVLAGFEQYNTALPVQNRVTAWYLAGSAQQELGRHEQAVELLRQIAGGDGRLPVQEKALYKLAVSQFALKQYDAMRQTLADLARRFPASETKPDAAYLLAAADAREGDVTRGAARLTALIDEGPEHPYYRPALLHRARLYEDHGQPANAADDYRRYLDAARAAGDTGDDVRQASLRLIDLLLQLERHDAAVAEARTLLDAPDLDPLTEQQAMYRLALAQIRAGQASEALATLNTLQEKHPLHAQRAAADYYRGLLMMSLGQPDAALPLLTTAGADESLGKAMRASALRLVALRQRETNQAEAAAKTLAQLESLVGRTGLNDAELLWLARQSLEGGKPEAAVAYATPLFEPRPGTPPEARAEAIYLAGRAYRELGQLDQAIHACRRVIAMSRGFDQPARLELARALADHGQVDAALAEYRGLIGAETSDVAAPALLDSARLLRQRAAERRRAGDPAAAREANEEALRRLKRLVLLHAHPELEPLPQQAYLELVEVAGELGDAQQRATALQEIVEKYRDTPYATLARAWYEADRQRYGEALALVQQLGGQTLPPALAERVEALRAHLEAQR